MKPPTLICDTSFVGHLTHRRWLPERYAEWGDAVISRVERGSPAVSVVTLAEARAGYLNARWGPSRIADAERHLRRYRPLPIRRIDLDEWARLRVAAGSRGISIGDNDLWIAATANLFGCALVTCDRDHVRIAQDLDVEVLFVAPPV